MAQENSQQAEIPSKKRAPWDETVRTVIVAVLIAVVFRSLLFEPFHIPSGSMKSNLLVGDYLFVSKYSYGYSRYSFPLGLPLFEGRVVELGKPQRGDVVVFRPPGNPGVDFIKRIIGLPGDRIRVSESVVYINGRPLRREAMEPFVDTENPSHALSMPRFAEELPGGKVIEVLQEKHTGFANNTAEYIVPEGHYFMMGDNRDNSRDSRFLDEVGYVPEENIVGRAEIILLSVASDAPVWRFWEWVPSLRAGRFFKVIE